MARLRSGFGTAKDAVLFVAGLALGGWTVTHPPVCEACLLVAVGLCVAPAALMPPGLAGGRRGEDDE